MSTSKLNNSVIFLHFALMPLKICTMPNILYAFLLFFCVGRAEESPTVNTSLGTILGTTLDSRNGRTYYAFKSIPYAKPPVGDLRLKNPEPVEPWGDALNATLDPIHCVQSNIYKWRERNVTSGSENCLYLNIYTPEINGSKLAVMVYIHGGGLQAGKPPSRAADFFIDENIVLVTIQYRLGPLGFLSTEDSVIPGNFGMKDQALALKWISQHISSFGGDPQRVTAFGESAGGLSTHLLMKSPMSKGLIKGAVSQSGTIYLPFGINKAGEATNFAWKIARNVGCPTNSSIDALTCLQRVDAAAITRASLDFLVFDFHPIITFAVVLEKPDPSAFITQEDFAKDTELPWINGFNSRDGAIISRCQKETYDYDFFRRNLDWVIGSIVGVSNDTESGQKVIKTIEKRFFTKTDSYDAILVNIEEFSTAFYFTCPLLKTLPSSKGPTFLYFYDYVSGSTKEAEMNFNETGVQPGASHGDETLLLMNQRDRFPKKKSDEDDMSKELVKLWANFAKFQNPSPSSKNEIKWPATGLNSTLTLRFNASPRLMVNYRKDLMAFCSSLPHFS